MVTLVRDNDTIRVVSSTQQYAEQLVRGVAERRDLIQSLVDSKKQKQAMLAGAPSALSVAYLCNRPGVRDDAGWKSVQKWVAMEDGVILIEREARSGRFARLWAALQGKHSDGIDETRPAHEHFHPSEGEHADRSDWAGVRPPLLSADVEALG